MITEGYWGEEEESQPERGMGLSFFDRVGEMTLEGRIREGKKQSRRERGSGISLSRSKGSGGPKGLKKEEKRNKGGDLSGERNLWIKGGCSLLKLARKRKGWPSWTVTKMINTQKKKTNNA